MKVCDAADWFGSDFLSVASSELRETPYLHRKQWEFVAIFQALRDAGVLRQDAVGASFGAGRERLLYALANRVGRLWATDLYSDSTIWTEARTSEVEAFLRSDPPFRTELNRLSVDAQR